MNVKAHKKDRYFPPTSRQPHPWLLISHGNSKDRHIFYSISENRYYSKSIPQLRGKVIQNSCHGWLILQDLYSEEFSLFNMVSMEVVQITPVPDFTFSYCILSSPPTDPDCRLVLFYSNPDIASSTIFFCKPSENSFNKHVLGIDGSAFLRATTFKGKIHGIISSTSELVVLDFDGPTPQATIVLDKTSHEQIFPPYVQTEFDYSLVEFSGELFLVLLMFEGCMTPTVDKISIFRADLSQKTWIKVKSIGEDCAIFLSQDGNMCYLVSPESGIKGNTIYFLNYLYDRCLYSFDLLDQSFSIYPPCPNVNRCAVSYCWTAMVNAS